MGRGSPGWVDLVRLKRVDLVRRVCGTIPWKVSAADQVRHRKVDLVRYGGITGESRSWKRRWGWTRLPPGAKGGSGAPGRPQNSIARGKSALYSPWLEAYQRSHTHPGRGSREPQLQQADERIAPVRSNRTSSANASHSANELSLVLYYRCGHADKRGHERV